MGDKVRKYLISMSGKPLLSDLTDCHLTLKFQPLQKEVNALPFGKKVRLRLVGYALHEYIQCFLVDILDDEVRRMCTNQNPHISVSCNRSICGPVVSNDLLMNGTVIPTINNYDTKNTENYNELYRNPKRSNGGGLIVEGRIGGYFKDGWCVRFEYQQKIEEECKEEKNDNGKQKKKKRKRGRRNSKQNENNQNGDVKETKAK